MIDPVIPGLDRAREGRAGRSLAVTQEGAACYSRTRQSVHDVHRVLQENSKMQNWRDAARRSGYSCAHLAQVLGISLRQLERRFRGIYGISNDSRLNSIS